jgi:hypothetical protein
MTLPEIKQLKKTADILFEAGTPSTSFCRILNLDYQIVVGDDLDSGDGFYNMASEKNQPMRSLLKCCGYEYTIFGITKL